MGSCLGRDFHNVNLGLVNNIRELCGWCGERVIGDTYFRKLFYKVIQITPAHQKWKDKQRKERNEQRGASMDINIINTKAFIADSIFELIEHKVEVLLGGANYIRGRPYDSIELNGYFIPGPKRILAVATGIPLEMWLPTFIHEFNHFRQWKEQAPIYLKAFQDGRETIEFIDEWVDRMAEFSDEEIQSYIERAREMEADCERRTYHMIEEHNLPIDLANYAQMSNAYIHFYNYVRRRREWYQIGKEPYRTPEIVKEMNTTIDSDFTTINEKYMELFEKHCLPDWASEPDE